MLLQVTTNPQNLGDFSIILLFMIGAVIIVGMAFMVNRIFRQQKPNEVKLSTYESGEDSTGTTWGHFNIQFYVIALIFLLFEAELLFLFPWAVIFADKNYQQQTQNLWGWFALLEIFIFILILVIGLVYVWKKGFLEWAKPNIITEDIPSHVPKKLYDDF